MKSNSCIIALITSKNSDNERAKYLIILSNDKVNILIATTVCDEGIDVPDSEVFFNDYF